MKQDPDLAKRQLAYSRKDAAAMLSMAPATLDRLVARGLLKPSRACRRPLFTEKELLRFLEETV